MAQSLSGTTFIVKNSQTQGHVHLISGYVVQLKRSPMIWSFQSHSGQLWEQLNPGTHWNQCGHFGLLHSLPICLATLTLHSLGLGCWILHLISSALGSQKISPREAVVFIFLIIGALCHEFLRQTWKVPHYLIFPLGGRSDSQTQQSSPLSLGWGQGPGLHSVPQVSQSPLPALVHPDVSAETLKLKVIITYLSQKSIFVSLASLLGVLGKLGCLGL